MSRVGRPITFSWHAARALRAAGWTYEQIADALGVHHSSVMYACDPYYRKMKRRKNRERLDRVPAAERGDQQQHHDHGQQDFCEPDVHVHVGSVHGGAACA